MRKVAMLSLIIALMVMITGCATSSQEIYKREKVNRILNNQVDPIEAEEKKIKEFFKTLKLKGNPLQPKTKKLAEILGADPLLTGKQIYIGKFAKWYMTQYPALSFRKFKTTNLVAKTGEKITYTLNFSGIAYALASYMNGRDFHYKWFMFKRLLKDIGKLEYFNRICNNAPTLKLFSKQNLLPQDIILYLKTPGGKELLSAHMNLLYLAHTLYNLSDKNPKISNILYWLTRGEYWRINKLFKEQEKDIKDITLDKAEDILDSAAQFEEDIVTMLPIALYRKVCNVKDYYELFNIKSSNIYQYKDDPTIKKMILDSANETCNKLKEYNDIMTAYEDFKQDNYNLFGLAVLAETIVKLPSKYLSGANICQYDLFDRFLKNNLVQLRQSGHRMLDIDTFVKRYTQRKFNIITYTYCLVNKYPTNKAVDLPWQGKMLETKKEQFRKGLLGVCENMIKDFQAKAYEEEFAIPHFAFYSKNEGSKACIGKVIAAKLTSFDKKRAIYLLMEAKRDKACKSYAEALLKD